MIWIILSFITAFFESFKDIFSKFNLKNLDEYVLATSYWIFQIPLLLLLAHLDGFPTLKYPFFLALGFEIILNVIVSILFMRALKLTDISLSIPMITFTPIFMLIFSPFLLKEYPSFLGLIGVILIVIGAYTLNLKQINQGFLAPIKALIKNPGSKLMLLVAFIWSFTAIFDKIGIINSSPTFWNLSKALTIGLLFMVILLFRHKISLPKQNKFMLPLVGLLTAIALTTQMYAMQLNMATYVIAIKRTSAIFGVLFGHFLLKEKGFYERILGVMIMILGVVLISIS